MCNCCLSDEAEERNLRRISYLKATKDDDVAAAAAADLADGRRGLGRRGRGPHGRRRRRRQGQEQQQEVSAGKLRYDQLRPKHALPSI